MRFLYLLFMLFCLSCASVVRADVLQFGNGVGQTQWRLVRGTFTCRLVQTIPDFGRAELVQRGDGRLSFAVHAVPGLYEGQMTRVSLVPAPWQVGGRSQVVSLSQGVVNRPVALNGEAAREVMLAFQSGRFVDFHYPADAPPRVRVSVSSLHFRTALGELQRCVQSLPQVSFADYAKTRVHFASGSYRLDKVAREHLERLVGYLKTYGGVKRIVVVGNTDNVGLASYNYLLGEHRARSVADFLRARGIKLPIEVISHGMYQPIQLNNTPSGRAQNRRVTITLGR